MTWRPRISAGLTIMEDTPISAHPDGRNAWLFIDELTLLFGTTAEERVRCIDLMLAGLEELRAAVIAAGEAVPA